MALIDRFVKKKGKIEIGRSSAPSLLLIDRFVQERQAPVIEPPKAPSFFERIKGLGVGAAKLAVGSGIAVANVLSGTLDFAADFLSNEIGRRIKGSVPGLPVVGKPSQTQINLATKWKNFYAQTGGEATEKIKSFTQELSKIEFIQPSERWQKLSTKEKFSPKNLPETVFNLGPGLISSFGLYAINVPLGIITTIGSVGDDIKTIAIESGMEEEEAERLSLVTGFAVVALDKIVPSKLFSPGQKEAFIGGFLKRVVKAGLLETVTEIAQENIQLFVESTLRDDLKMDEVVLRNLMAGLGGLLGGVGSQTIVSFSNGIRNGDFGEVEEAIEAAVVPEVVTEPEKVVKVGLKSRYKNIDEYVEAKGLDPASIEIIDNENFIVENTSGERATLEEIPISRFGKPRFETALKQKPGKKITDPIEVEVREGKYRITDGANRFTQAVANGDETIPAVVSVEQKVPAKVTREISQPKKPIDVKVKIKEAVTAQVKEVKLVTEKSVQNVKNIKDVRTTLKTIRQNFIDLTTEVESKAIVAQEQREGLNVKDINQLKRIIARSKKFQEGDIETIRATNTGALLNRVIENVQEMRENMSESEAFDFAMNLPTQATAQQRTTTEIRELAKKEKVLSKFLETLKAKQKDLDIQQDDALFKQWQSVLNAQEQLIQLIKVPSRQLPVGEGKERVSRLQARLKGALDAATEEDIEELGLSTYRQMNQEDQIARAVEYVTNNTEDAFRVVRGEIDPPKGLLQNSVFVALVELGKVDTDVATKVATLTATRFGQEINILKKILADNPVVMMQDITEITIEAYEKRTGKKAEVRVKTEINTITSKVKPTTKEQWDIFIASIRC